MFGAITMTAAGHRFTLVIDAGHGGKDAGALGKISKEKDINLRTALAFGKFVENNCPDVNVIYTRRTDVFVTLHGRAEIANKAKADLFISIHTNSLPPGNVARGFETYTLGMHRANDNLDVAKRENSVILVEKDYKEHYEGFDPNSAESYIIFEFMQDHNMARSVELAKYVQNNVCSLAKRPNKGVKQAGFLVLRETSMPSCLIELGFISTADEEQYLNSETGISNIARGIYNAFVAYKKKYDTTSKATYKTETAVETASKAVNDTLPKVETKQKTEQPKQVAREEKRATLPDEKPLKPEEQKVKKESKNISTASAATTASAESSAPVFKVQILTADRLLKTTDRRFKGHNDVAHYKEGNILKYTIGETTNYNEILQIRKSILQDFPDAFVIAFKNGEKMNVNEAIKEFKNRKR